MTKRTYHYIVEMGWLLLALMPVILYLVAARNTGGAEMMTFADMMEQKLGFFNTGNVIYTTIDGVFGAEGVLPILTDGLTAYLTYYITVEIVHLIVDVLIFIPRMAQSWITAFERKTT